MNDPTKATFLLLLLLPTALLYALGTFAAWDANPAHWEPMGRFLLGLLDLIGTGIAFCVIVSED